MRRLIVLFVMIAALALAGIKPASAHKDFCDTGCWAATEGYIIGCREQGGDATTCLQRASQIYYACLCSCRHNC